MPTTESPNLRKHQSLESTQTSRVSCCREDSVFWPGRPKGPAKKSATGPAVFGLDLGVSRFDKTGEEG